MNSLFNPEHRMEPFLHDIACFNISYFFIHLLTCMRTCLIRMGKVTPHQYAQNTSRLIFKCVSTVAISPDVFRTYFGLL